MFLVKCTRILHRTGTNKVCVCIYAHTHTHTNTHTGVYFKEVVYAVMKAGKSTVCRMGWQAGDPGKSQCCS